MLFNLMEEYGEKLDGKLITARADIDYVPELFADYGVTEIPTMIIFDGGEPFQPHVGFKEYADIDRYLYKFYGYLPYKAIYADIEKYT